jgi:hypothetical protein
MAVIAWAAYCVGLNFPLALGAAPVVGALVVAFLALLVFVVGAWRQRRYHARLRSGLCVRCGYDIRANRDACPECNMPILKRLNPVTGEEIRDHL